jgi:GAF domain-containing protein
MLRKISTIFALPVYPNDEDKTRKARYAHVIALAFLVLPLGFEVLVRIFGEYAQLSILDLIVFGVVSIALIGLLLLKHDRVELTSLLLVVLTWVATNALAASGYGAKDASFILNFAIVLMAGLLLSWQASLVITALSIASGFALAYAEQNGLIQVASYPITSFARDITFVFGLNWVLMYLLIHGLETALKKSRISLAQLESANSSLYQTQDELRTRSTELMFANQELEKRTRKLHAITIVTRTLAAIPTFESFLHSVSRAISERLGYYHIGLFLLDERKEFAILRSANTEGGQRMLAADYRIPMKQIHPITSVAQTGQPNVFHSLADDKDNFYNAEVPGTRSALILPLKAGDQVIGVLDLESDQISDFSEEDISILSVLADQLAINIQNLLLYEQAQNALREAHAVSAQTSTRAWRDYEKAIQTKGYRYDGIKSEPLKEPRGAGKETASLAVPIRLRGQTIGSFKLNPSSPSRGWTDDEVAMVRATAERVALALEGARLLDEAQKRAAREAFLSNVATKLSASFQLDSILRDTVQELGQTLKSSTVTFQLVNPSESGAPIEDRTNGSSAHRTD